jgi:hypothetical protein
MSYEPRICRFCKKSEDSSRLLKYEVRHYAHAKCGLAAQGVAFLDHFTDWQCTQFPYFAALGHGVETLAELMRRCDKYAAENPK